MEWWMYLLSAIAIYAVGIYSGIFILKKVWLEPGFKMGFIQDGHDAYTITKKRQPATKRGF